MFGFFRSPTTIIFQLVWNDLINLIKDIVLIKLQIKSFVPKDGLADSLDGTSTLRNQSIILVSIENIINWTLKSVFDQISKHLDALQKHTASRHIFNSLLGFWKCDQTLSFVNYTWRKWATFLSFLDFLFILHLSITFFPLLRGFARANYSQTLKLYVKPHYRL